MKSRFLSPIHFITFVSAVSLIPANADSGNWFGATDALWSTSSNWSSDPNPVPATGNTATFDNAGGAVDTIDLGPGVTIGSIVFDTAAVAAYTLGAGAVGSQSLILDDNGSIIATNGINANQIFNAALILGADGSAQSYAFTNADGNNSITFEGAISGGSGGVSGAKTISINSNSSGGIVLKGLVSNGGATSLGIVKTGTGQLNLSSVAHTFSGGVEVREGFLNISGNGSANNSTISLGAAGNTGSIVRIGVVNSGTNPASPLTIVDQTSGIATTRILSTNSSTSGQWSGPITMNDDLTVSTATAGSFTLQSGATVNLNSNTLTLANSSTSTTASAANVIVKGKISGNGNVVVNNTSAGNPNVGLVILEGTAHDYTGTTTISGGILQLGNNGTVGSLTGTSSITNNGTLAFRRTDAMTQGTHFPAAISGTGGIQVTATNNVTLNSSNTYSGVTSISKSGTLTIAPGGSIAPTTGATLNIGFSVPVHGGGAGTLQYNSAATSKFGAIVIGNSGNAGTLNQTNGVINGTSMSLGGGNSTGNGGIVSLGNASGDTAQLNISGNVQVGTSGAFNSTLTVNPTGTLNITGNLNMATSADRSATGTITQSPGSAVSAASLSLSSSFNETTSSRTHTSVYNLNGGTLSVGSITSGTPGAGTPPSVVMTMSNTFNFDGGTLKATASNPSYWVDSVYTTANVKDGGAKIDTSGFDITIAQPLVKFAGSTTDTLTKDGLGKLTLAGTNTFTGATTVNAGTLDVSGSLAATAVEVKNNATLAGSGPLGGSVTIRSGGRQAFEVAATAGSQTARTIAGLLTLEAGTVIDLTAAAPPAPGGPYVLLTATGGITGSVGTVNLNGLLGSVVKNGNNLELTVTAPAGFTAWAATPSFGLGTGDQDPTDDPDSDGMENLLEFVLNGNPGSSDPSILPDLVVTATDFEFTFSRRDDSLAPETTQTFQWGSDLSTWPGSITIPATSGTVGVATVTVTDGNPADTVKISIPRSQASGNQLFGRIQVTKP